MSDRGLPILDGAPACPFVAFDDDREERSTAPDPRHRCYAEVRPAPRANAHQDAYCLSSSFAFCPTFQDWARREGARAHEEPRTDSALEEVPRRNPSRGWAAPPPWLGEDGDDGDGDGADGESVTTPAPGTVPQPGDFITTQWPAQAGLAGSLAHQIALDAVPPTPAALGSGTGYAIPPALPPGPLPGSAAAMPGPAGASGSDRVIAEAGAPVGAGGGGAGSQRLDRDPYEPDDDRRAAPGDRGRPAEGSLLGSILPGRGRPKVGDTRPRRRSGDAQGPPWERPYRYEAYPTIRTRMGLPQVPRVVLLFIALLLAAMALFFLPTLLGFNAPNASPSPQPGASRSAAPSGLGSPTLAPGPTPLSYIVQPGDTMSKIAAKFGVPLADLIAANKDTHPDPDKIVAGDTLVIPAAQPTTFSDAGTPVPSPRASPTRAPSPTVKR